MKRIFIIGLAFTSFGTMAQAIAEDSKKFDLSGTVDVYYRTNLTAPNGDNYIAPGTSFANLPGFALGMANLVASYKGGKVGFVADLVFGPRGSDAVFNSPMYSSTGDIINQLYAYYYVNESVKFTLGNFNTFLGYEVISPADNFNYSTSYLFSYGPFSHTGLKADVALSEDLSLMVGVMNGTDFTEFNPNANYAIGGQLGYLDQYLNILLDPSFFEIDFTGGADVTEDLFLGVNAAYLKGKDNAPGFYGAALYPQYATSENLTIGLRTEYFVENGAYGAIGSDEADTSIFAITLTGSYVIKDLILKPELRLDTASADSFIDNDLKPTKDLGSFVLAAIYQF